MDLKGYVETLGIHNCCECEEIRRLQSKENKDIRVAPLFWQGEAQIGIPLVIMGINPSLVGTANEPLRGGDFDRYYEYYQHRGRSEDETRRLPKPKRVPFGYWTRCQNLACRILGYRVDRWRDYILTEVIHCFFDRTSDLDPKDFSRVGQRCFNHHTLRILKALQPQQIVLLGIPAYEMFVKYLHGEALQRYAFGHFRLGDRDVPVLRHPHPGEKTPGGWYREDVYEKFRTFCSPNRERPDG